MMAAVILITACSREWLEERQVRIGIEVDVHVR